MGNIGQDQLSVYWPFINPAKWQATSPRGAYGEVEESDPDLNELSYPQNISKKTRTMKILRIITKLFFAVSYVMLAYYVMVLEKRAGCVLGNEKIYDDVSIVYESVRFQRAGFHDHRHNDMTIYEGAPNTQNEAAWNRLMSVGAVAISEEENSRIANGTSTTREGQKQHVVELEMFHQFHCLKWLRDQFWQLNYAVTLHMPFEEFPQRENHTDHCIDYLRQVIMCHGDITPITFEYIAEIDGYIAHHSTEHQCRNFEAIYEWATRRNTTGFEVDERHQNVDIQEFEKFD